MRRGRLIKKHPQKRSYNYYKENNYYNNNNNTKIAKS